MSNQAFSTTSGNPLSAQPVTSGKVIIRSTSASEAGYVSVYGTVSGSPAVEGITLSGKVEKSGASLFSSLTQAITGAPPVGTITGIAPGVSAIGDLRMDSNPADGDTLSIGLYGSLWPCRFKSTMASVGDVKIGSTIADTMAHLCHAINRDGTDGVDYYSLTLANPFVIGSLSVDVITLTDRIACSRQLAWVITESASNFSKRVPIGGVDGITLFSLAPSVLSASNSLTFNAPDRTSETLPALMLAVCGYIPVGGSQAMYRIYTSQAITGNFEYSDDLLTWRATSEGTLTLGAGEHHASFSELHEYIRFNVLTNANTTNTILDARVVW